MAGHHLHPRMSGDRNGHAPSGPVHRIPGSRTRAPEAARARAYVCRYEGGDNGWRSSAQLHVGWRWGMTQPAIASRLPRDVLGYP